MAFQIGDKYYHDDIESGEIVEISKQAYEALGDMAKRVKSMIVQNKEIKRTIQIHSTMADDSGACDFRSLWEDWQSSNES